MMKVSHEMMTLSLIEAHYKDNHKRLMKRMGFRVGEEWSGQDVVQTAYERALKYHRSFNGEDFDRWFNTIVNNTLREYKNIQKGHTTVEYDDEGEGDGTPCSMYPGRVIAQIYELIDTKSPVQSEILMLYFHQEYSPRDISLMTPYKYKMVHQIILRFRNELKELYE